MEKYYIAEYQLMDSQSAMLMDAEEIMYDAENEEEYETLRALEDEDWMNRTADIVCIRTKEKVEHTLQQLQNDGFTLCYPYYDDDYVYFQKRIVIQ